MLRKRYTLLLAIVLMTSIACGTQDAPQEALTGEWVHVQAPLYELYAFADDGTVTYTVINSQDGRAEPTVYAGSYELINNQMLVINMPADSKIFGVVISGNRLTLRSETNREPTGTETGGQDYIYQRVK